MHALDLEAFKAGKHALDQTGPDEMEGWMAGRMDGWMRWMDGWMDGWVDG